jgi:hypothetical protein
VNEGKRRITSTENQCSIPESKEIKYRTEVEQRKTRQNEDTEEESGCEDRENTKGSRLKGFADDKNKHYGETEYPNVRSKPRPDLERE